MKSTPHLRVAAKAVIEGGSAILALHPSKIDLNRKWQIPGGIRDDIEEPILMTALREVDEETGIDLAGVEARPFKLGEWSAIDHGEPVRILAVFFHFRIPHQPSVRLSHEHDEFAWLDPDNYRAFDANPEVYEIIELLLPNGSDNLKSR